MKRFLKNVKKYWSYSLCAAKAELKAEVANSYLNWLWWILDPLSFMIIYTFMVKIVFNVVNKIIAFLIWLLPDN